MQKPKHIPIRTCVACRTTDAKRTLLRVVRLAEGGVCHDPKGKLSGRGAYVCASGACIALARKQKKLERSLKVQAVPETVFHDLNACAREHEASARTAVDVAGSHGPLELLDSPTSETGGESGEARSS